MSSDPLQLLRAATQIKNQGRVIGALLGTRCAIFMAKASRRTGRRPIDRCLAPSSRTG